MKSLVLGFILLGASWAHAQVPTFQVVSFYETGAYLTERFIPFGVRSAETGAMVEAVESVEVTKPCYSMIDPYRAHVFFIYCTEEIDASFLVTVKQDGKFFKIPLPPIAIKKLALISSTPQPTGPTKPVKSAGRKLFETKNCNQCHQAPYLLSKGQTVTSLKSAINSEDQMAKYKNKMSDDELATLVKFINEEL